MARTKEFDPDAALDRAVAVFRSSAYEAVSTSELCSAMGIARQSMYDTFGDKASLYRAALDRYQARSHLQIEDCMQDRTPLEAIGAVFEMLATLPRAERRNGCMLVNAIGELVAIDTAIASVAKDNQRRLIGLFSDLIRSGQALGDIEPSLDSKAAATQLLGSFYGVRVMAKADPSSTAATLAARTAVDFLRPR